MMGNCYKLSFCAGLADLFSKPDFPISKPFGIIIKSFKFNTSTLDHLKARQLNKPVKCPFIIINIK